MALFLRLIKWFFQALLVIIVAGAAISYLINPVVSTRIMGLPFGGKLGVPAPVYGGPSIDISLAGDKLSISEEALQAVVQYGAEQESHALIVYHNGRIQLEHYYGDHSAEEFTNTQSMHKSVLAMLIGLAIADGYIESADTPAAQFITEWAEDERAKITIRNMLKQESGIYFPTFDADSYRGFLTLIMGDNIAPVALGQPAEFPPASRFDYNSVNPQVLGILLERATGKSYAEYLSEALWSKLGVPDAEVLLDSEQHGMARTFCCLNATARAWLHLGLLHLNKGSLDGRQIVPAEWMQEMVQPGQYEANYGYLTWLGTEYREYQTYNRKTATRVYHSEPFTTPDIIYFDGFGGQRVYAIPSQNMVIVRVGALALEWDDALLPNTLVQGIIR
ncbi:MAG: serine hydrolase domain-containing protein [Gammaproteobacteria bacterium]